jgi:hypothetical protein
MPSSSRSGSALSLLRCPLLASEHALSTQPPPLLAGDLQFTLFTKKKRGFRQLGELGGLRCQWGSSHETKGRKKTSPEVSASSCSVKKRQIRDEETRPAADWVDVRKKMVG